MSRAACETRRAQRLLLEALQEPEKLPGLPPADWELLLRVARRARVLGRLESDLARAGLLDDIPERAAAHLRAARNVIAHRNTLISWEVKPPALGAQGYRRTADPAQGHCLSPCRTSASAWPDLCRCRSSGPGRENW